MSASTAAAFAQFQTAIQNASHLLILHRVVSVAPGRRREEMSLNRGAVVLSVAAWQAFVEYLCRAILTELEPPAGQPGLPLYRLISADVNGGIGRFNTPDARNTVELLARVNFDPTPAWGVTFEWERQWSARRNGPITVRTTLTPQEARQELDAWLQVRHRVAHGRGFANDARIAALLTGRSASGPTLTHKDADRCFAFFHELARATATQAHVLYP